MPRVARGALDVALAIIRPQLEHLWPMYWNVSSSNWKPNSVNRKCQQKVPSAVMKKKIGMCSYM
jgi:hypothetical protein